MKYIDGRSKRRNTPEKFWQKIDKGYGCWDWVGFKTSDTYGQITVDSRSWRTHRYAFSISKGKIPKGLGVLHKCDNPACVKPWHLFLGTNQDNMRDKMIKGRGTKGETHGRCVVTTEQVLEIRRRHANGERVTRIAKDYDVHRTTVSHICLRRNWQHV